MRRKGGGGEKIPNLRILLVSLLTLAVMALPACAAVEETPLTVEDTPLSVRFYICRVYQEGTRSNSREFTNLTVGGERPYIKAEWDFDGDGIFDRTLSYDDEALVMAPITYTYDDWGTYNVKLQMTDNAGNTACWQDEYICSIHDPWSHPDEVGAPLNVRFAMRLSSEVAKLVVFTNLTTGGVYPHTKAEWDFDGDGVFDLTLTGTEEDVRQTVTHIYDSWGIYDVTLQMTDSTPATECYELKVVVENADAPQIRFRDIIFPNF